MSPSVSAPVATKPVTVESKYRFMTPAFTTLSLFVCGSGARDREEEEEEE